MRGSLRPLVWSLRPLRETAFPLNAQRTQGIGMIDPFRECGAENWKDECGISKYGVWEKAIPHLTGPGKLFLVDHDRAINLVNEFVGRFRVPADDQVFEARRYQ